MATVGATVQQPSLRINLESTIPYADVCVIKQGNILTHTCTKKIFPAPEPRHSFEESLTFVDKHYQEIPLSAHTFVILKPDSKLKLPPYYIDIDATEFSSTDIDGLKVVSVTVSLEEGTHLSNVLDSDFQHSFNVYVSRIFDQSQSHKNCVLFNDTIRLSGEERKLEHPPSDCKHGTHRLEKGWVMTAPLHAEEPTNGQSTFRKGRCSVS